MEAPGAYTGMLWEYGPTDQCYINTTVEAPCQQGYVPQYSVNASSIKDIQTAVRFANKHDLYLVIKNTGHDHLGRSSGGNGFSIWTHYLKGRTWHDSFVPVNAPKDVSGQPAVTLQAGEQWVDVYHAAATERRIVVGGHARTVGSAGGWLTGGGHSAWSNIYGLGIDNVLEVDVITPTGELVTLNPYTNQDHFWAIRGGGGCAFGIVTHVTYKTHPEPDHIQAVLVQVNATTNETLKEALSATLKALDIATAAGYTGYGYINQLNTESLFPAGFGAILLKPNGDDESFFAAAAPFLKINNSNGISSLAFPLIYPRWIDYINVYLTDQNIAQNVVDASRLLTPSVIHNETANEALVDMMIEHGAGLNFIGRVNTTGRSNTAVHPAWAESIGVLSFGTNWEDEAPFEEKQFKRQLLVAQSERLGEIFGPTGGTYINEANPFEPDWQNVFWGSNYARLLGIKRSIDPTNLFVCNRCVGTDIVFEAS
ncbi:hypothetical protein H2198_009195 [Neophaeococcomyces mojaviensis]|uniref:Uncharacterized protein n=1 Tax=Neophaeococcomyces mojaviensis TaxID=3383035 RepID=A0ACC2ZV29_9EURO|nr:hypothetical protein H2198_009195 [Knufia sp. JES_112]